MSLEVDRRSKERAVCAVVGDGGGYDTEELIQKSLCDGNAKLNECESDTSVITERGEEKILQAKGDRLRG